MGILKYGKKANSEKYLKKKNFFLKSLPNYK